MTAPVRGSEVTCIVDPRLPAATLRQDQFRSDGAGPFHEISSRRPWVYSQTR